MTETVVAAFGSASAAEAAVEDLHRAKIPSAMIRSYTKEDPDYSGYTAREPQRKGGFGPGCSARSLATPRSMTPTTPASPPAIPL